MNKRLGALLGLAAGHAFGCGHCVEDRVAVVYDYAVEQQALREGLDIAYLGVDGTVSDDVLRAALAGEAGIAAATLRTAAAPRAVAFAWNTRETGLDALLARANGRLAAGGATLLVLRTWSAAAGLH
ncbi:MAG: hypothetical protein HY943_09525 [Gammaproteobacteria bacterium]|nr:hypothetical protein [Gammaproteobacteria bacterium]